MNLTAKGIGYDIRLARMVANFAIIITQKLGPSTLSHVELFLIKDVLKTFVVGEYHTFSAIEVVSPSLQSKHDSTKLEIVCRIVSLIGFELTRSVGNSLASLHEDTTETLVGSITKDYEIFIAFRKS